jgi:iron complex transport system permease protein
MRPLTFQGVIWRCGVLAIILVVVVVIALKLGAVPVSLYGLGLDLLHVLVGKTGELSSNYNMIVYDIRLPRILLSIVVGASLAVAGTAFQALLRNPLADPYILGASSGASLGAMLTLIAGPYLALPLILSAVVTPLGAFLGAAATVAVVYFLGSHNGQLDSNTLLLSGIVSGSFLSAIITFLISTLAGRGDLRGILFWLMGDLSASLQPSVRWVLGIGFLVATAIIYTTASDLNLLLNGEKEAMHLGVDVRRVRLVVYIAASLLTGLAVSFSGAIGYVGLLVPHVMRLIFGSDHRILIPTSAFGGAIVLVIADTVARTVVAPSELPVGAMTALAGAPLFIYLLRRKFA